ncbi:hypothetical protein JCM6882_000356 [Rhodosporidiobolus microsporus]
MYPCDSAFRFDPYSATSFDPVALSSSSPPPSSSLHRGSSSNLSPLSPTFTPASSWPSNGESCDDSSLSSDSTPPSHSFLSSRPVSFSSSSSNPSSSTPLEQVKLAASLSLTRHLRTKLDDAQRRIEGLEAEVVFHRERADEAQRAGRMERLKWDGERKGLERARERAEGRVEEVRKEGEGRCEREKRRAEEQVRGAREEKMREEERYRGLEGTVEMLSAELVKLSEKNVRRPGKGAQGDRDVPNMREEWRRV